MDLQNFDLLKHKLIERGKKFKANAQSSTRRIASLATSFIRDGAFLCFPSFLFRFLIVYNIVLMIQGMVILTHGHSRVVNSLLIASKQQGKRFTVFLTESRPDSDA